LDSKIASRGAGLQSYDEKEVSPALMAELLQKYAGDMDAAKRELRMRDMKTKEAEQFFRTGVKLMERGKYKMAIEEIGKAISAIPGGASSREGGQYTIWLGQAFDANGQRGKAVMTMRALKTHDDRDVRRVAGGIEYILTSPELKLNPKNYQSFDLEKLDQIKQGKKALQYSKMEKPPEKYSLEWYMLQKPPPPDEKKSAGSGSLAVAFSAITATALFFMSAGAGPS
jgi:predicted  nucleic acid-binding Zn-ribbon protein